MIAALTTPSGFDAYLHGQRQPEARGGLDALARLPTITTGGVPAVRTADLFAAPPTGLAFPLNRKTTESAVRAVPLAKLEPRQDIVPVAGLKAYVPQPRRDPSDVVHVVMQNGRERWLIQEGHTRLAAAALRGEDTVEARVWEFVQDALGQFQPVPRGLQKKRGLLSLGGSGSGNFGHAGRPGEVGGSGGGAGSDQPTKVYTAGKSVQLPGRYDKTKIPEGSIAVTSAHGYITATKSSNNPDYVWINHVLVNEKARGQGEGTALYKGLLDAAKAQGFKGVLKGEILTRGVSTNAQAIWASFERKGWTEKITETLLNPETGKSVQRETTALVRHASAKHDRVYQLGEGEGHPFRGNQYTNEAGEGGGKSAASVTVGGRRIAVVRPKRAKSDVMVTIDVPKWDATFSRQPSMYVGPGGSGAAIGTRYAAFGKWLDEHESMEASEVHVRPDGVVDYTNGRHRYAWLRDHGVTKMPVLMDKESLKHAQAHGYVESAPKESSPKKRQGDSLNVPMKDPKKLKALVESMGLKLTKIEKAPDGSHDVEVEGHPQEIDYLYRHFGLSYRSKLAFLLGDAPGHPFRGNQYSDVAGEGGGGGGGTAKSAVPREPGTTPVPKGKIRGYHYTDSMDSVEEHGLDVSKARGSRYGEPNAIWFSTAKPSNHKDYVEVFVDADEVAGGGPLTRLEPTDSPENVKRLEEFNQGTHDFMVYTKGIPPDRFVSTHRPWHDHYRYFEENPETGKAVVAGEYDDLLDDPGHGPAIRAYKEAHRHDLSYREKVALSLGGHGSGNFGHAGRPGEVGGSSDDGGGEGPALFARNPKLAKFETIPVLRSEGTSGHHPEAEQRGGKIYLYPKFDTLSPKAKDFVFAHEVGHAVLSDQGLSTLVEKAEKLGIDVWDTDTLPFGQNNMHEAFADAFASYHTDPDELTQRYPAWAKLVKQFVDADPRTDLGDFLNHPFRGNQYTDVAGEGGGGGGKSTGTQSDLRPGPYARPHVVKVSKVKDAIPLILAGKVVALKNPKKVNTLLDRLADLTRDAVKRGEDAPQYDACKITVKGVSFFCAGAIATKEFPQGIPRIAMPQFKTQPQPGSLADKLPRDDEGRVDASDLFMEHLDALKIPHHEDRVKSNAVMASQKQLDGPKIAKRVAQKDWTPKGKIFISSDGYIIDGHHRWAAAVGRDVADGHLGDIKLDVVRVDAPITEILQIAKKWTKKMGLGSKGVGAKSLAYQDKLVILLGGAGSGNFGHAGRPGEVGGSADAGPNGNDGQPTGSHAEEARLQHEAGEGSKAVQALVDSAVKHADFRQTAEDDDWEEEDNQPHSWDDLTGKTQIKVEQAWKDGEYEQGVDIDDSGIVDDMLSDLRNDNDEVIKAAEKGLLDEMKEAFPHADPTLPMGDQPGFALYKTLDPETITVGEDEGKGAALKDLEGLRFTDGSELTAAEQNRVRADWDSQYRHEFGKASEKLWESDDYYERRNELEADTVGQMWNDMSEADKLHFAVNSSVTLLTETPPVEAGGMPAHWRITDDESSPGSKADYQRTRAIARQLVTDRTLQLLKERGLPEYDAKSLANNVWTAWKGSSNNEASQAFQLAVAQELGGLHRFSPGDASQILKRQGGNNDVMRAYVRAQWEVTQFLLKQSGAGDHMDLYRAILVPHETLAPLAREGVGTSPSFVWTRLPDIALQRNGAASATLDRGVANAWDGVDLPGPRRDFGRVVLRLRAPTTSILSLPVFGKNVYSEREVIVAGTKGRWQWDAYLDSAPEIAEIPVGTAGTARKPDPPLPKSIRDVAGLGG